MQYNKVEICGINTCELKLLKESEKIELLKKAHAGDEKAREKLINGNLRLVLSVVQRFSNRGENPDDLFQVGVIGLIKAIDNFDTSLNVRFSTYTVPMIIGEIRRFLRDNNSIRVSRSLRDTAYKAIHAKEYYIDPEQVAIWGDSSGGHAAQMVGVTGDMELFKTEEYLSLIHI